MRRYFALLLAFLMIFCFFGTSVSAYTEKTGIINITMRKGETFLSDGKVTLYRVGELREVDGEYRFFLLDPFAANGLTIESLSDPASAQELYDITRDADISGAEYAVGQDGKLTVSNLQVGLYLIVQSVPSTNYGSFSPFVVALPNITGDGYYYSIDVAPKIGEYIEVPPTDSSVADKLPQTGQLYWPIPVLAFSGVVFFALGLIIYSGRKRDEK